MYEDNNDTAGQLKTFKVLLADTLNSGRELIVTRESYNARGARAKVESDYTGFTVFCVWSADPAAA